MSVIFNFQTNVQTPGLRQNITANPKQISQIK